MNRAKETTDAIFKQNDLFSRLVGEHGEAGGNRDVAEGKEEGDVRE